MMDISDFQIDGRKVYKKEYTPTKSKDANSYNWVCIAEFNERKFDDLPSARVMAARFVDAMVN